MIDLIIHRNDARVNWDLPIQADVHAPEEDLLTFERKYGIRSETFYAAYINGEEPEDDNWVLDFGEGASVYRTWLARRQALPMADQ